MSNLTDLNHHSNILIRTHYVTDLFITPQGEEKVLALRWYTYVPFLGRIISYLRYKVCNPSFNQRQLREISEDHKSYFKGCVTSYIEGDKQLEEIYKHYTVINQFFSDLN